jgi:hypothetical protein
MTLTFEQPQPKTELATILYGPEGVGKTTGATSAPGPIVFLNADAPGALRFARKQHAGTEIREVKVTGRQSLTDAYLYLQDGGDGARTVVLDSMGRIYDVVLADIAKDDAHPSLPERGDANTFIERYVLALLELPVHVVLVAHDLPVKVTGNDDDGTATHELFPFCGTNNPALAKKLMRAVDVVAYCGRIPAAEDGEQDRYVAQLFSAGGRRAKDRTGVIAAGDEPVDLDLSAWADLNAAEYASAAAISTKGEK